MGGRDVTATTGTGRLFPARVEAVLWAAAAAAFGALAVLGLAVAPPDAVQGDAQRIMYLHVPTAWVAYLAFGVTALASGLYLWPRTRAAAWDRLAGASAEIGVLCTGLTLALGSLWGRPIWGVWWAWDARLITTAVLFFLYLGYLALRRVLGPTEAGARRAAVAALVAFVDVPIVHFSVEWWRTLHQRATVFTPDLRPEIEGVMGLTLWVGVLAFTLGYLALVALRYRIAGLEAARDAAAVEQAIAARVAAADAATGSAAEPAGVPAP
jgi:heme exporter protein C